ncbi:hypothetical protein BH09ACT8_BH09ACT8_19800 [soil metagenome]
MDILRLGTFTPSVLLDIARTTGRLYDSGLQVREIAVPSSPAQFASLRDGDFDAVFTSPDNVLAYRFLPGNPLGELLDVEIVAGIDRGLGLCLGARPRAVSGADIRGGRLGVDVPNSGFAFVAYALLERLGLTRDEYQVVTLGSTPKRAIALRDGGCDATVLNAGNELIARAAGCTLLADVTLLGPYLGTVVARVRSAPGANAVDRLIDVLRETAADICSGDLDDETCAAAVRVLGLDPAPATEHLAVLRDPARGLIPGGTVDTASFETLVDLRRRYLSVPELDGIVARLDEVVRSGSLLH